MMEAAHAQANGSPAQPHNIELEQALLGAVLVNNEAFYRVPDFLQPRHFFESLHQRIYDACRA
jgi:replicative DNA helicase